jgi:hypothetical protein
MPIPSRLWFPTNLAARALWFDNFATQFAIIAASLGFLPAVVTQVQDDNTCFQGIASGQVELDAFVEAVRQFRIQICEAVIGSPTPAFPAAPVITPAEIPLTGIYQRLIELVDQIRVASAYTPEIGALLGIIPSGGGGPTPEADLKPVIKVGQSFGDFKFTVNVTRLQQPGFKIQIQRAGESTWTDVAFATKNPCTVTVTPLVPGQPERILVRAILLANNEPVGAPSDPAYVTVNP